MIGGKNGHKRVAVFVTQMNCGEGDCGGGVASDWFREDVSFCGARKLFANFSGLIFVGDDPKIGGTKKGRETRGGLLQHCFCADDIEKLLRRASAAAGPEAGAASSG